ncbi:hypothetical protein BD410DRAFT_804319 [Rickenella mellea]|uniref:Uncharacterized protein n=1 Tax=Rickenella mellea TaxID=50990 RepID=A0A4Y7Q287_9AGAM|nr:hypothetical protein BD410DRAFT_804319 [Rickenella mellea]
MATQGAIADWLGVVASITNPLNFILVNRLVLNLRRVSHLQEGNVPTLGAIRTIQEPAFAVNSLLGNLGAPLRVGQDDDDEIDEIGIDDDAEVAEERRVVDHGEIIEEIRDSEP